MYKWAAIAAIGLVWGCSSEQDPVLWEENFDGNTLDLSQWNYELGNGCPNVCGWGNNERQEYTKDNHTVSDGMLHIFAKKEGEAYTSTRITTKTKFSFTYGKLEARAKLPVGQGIWPAIWLLGSNIDEVGWPLSGEIDMLEYVGREPHMVFNSLHTQASHGNTINTKKTEIKNIEEGFHTYAIDWTPEKIDFLVDGKLTYSFVPKDHSVEEWPFDKPFFVLVNMAIGGNFGGPEVDDSIFPQEFVVDYIRVTRNKFTK